MLHILSGNAFAHGQGDGGDLLKNQILGKKDKYLPK